ncbi:MAG: helix-turn-helix transcriptional regulator [Deltaproteobacteria bacterium]|nr:helix-turn-helix transcriptional regulator [Deltaproteobacteria bacterium]
MNPEDLTVRREALELTRARLAHHLGVSYTTIYRWEDGRRHIPPWVDKFLALLERVQGCERCRL